MFQTIINKMPPHECYIEAFLGGGAILRNKRPATRSIGINADGDVVHNFIAIHPDAGQIPNLHLIHANSLDWLSNHYTFAAATLVYMDPPYLLHTRSSQRQIYRYELSDQDHMQLLELATGLPCMVMISGYASDLYDYALSDWTRYTFQAQTRGGTSHEEVLWCNFPTPDVLHDCRYAGINFRERERIKRKKQRWQKRLAAMEPIERQAILEAVQEFNQVQSSNMTIAAAIAIPGDAFRKASPFMTTIDDHAINDDPGSTLATGAEGAGSIVTSIVGIQA